MCIGNAITTTITVSAAAVATVTTGSILLPIESSFRFQLAYGVSKGNSRPSTFT